MTQINESLMLPPDVILPCVGVDSHAHLDGQGYDTDREAVLDRARAAGIAQIGNIFLGPEDFAARKALFAHRAEVFFLLGIHPCDGMQCTPDALDAMRAAFAQEPRLRAVGEIGLDFHWQDCPKELQYKAFTEQLALARSLDKPVVIHCREAEEEMLAVLEAQGMSGRPLLWHCFGGDPALARRVCAHGWHVSVPGPVTYKPNDALRAAVAVIPPERLMLETDCPYLSPVPRRGKRNEPAYSVFTARAVAAARHERPEELWRRCGDNARRFFGLPELAGVASARA